MKKIDELVKRVEFFERLAVYGDRKSFLKRIAQDASFQGFQGSTMVGDSGEPPAQESDSVMNMPADHITGRRQIKPETQKMLNEILQPLAVAGKIFFAPLKPDGILGDSTKQALKSFKDSFNQPATEAAIAQVYNSQKQKNQVVDLDGAAKSRDEYYKSQSIPPGMPGSRT